MKKAYKPDFNHPVEVYTEFHRRELWNFLYNLFEWGGDFPDTIDKQYFNSLLLRDGYAPFFRYNDMIISSTGAPHGLDRQLKSTMFNVANPYLKSVKRKVGSDCVLCFNTLNYREPESCNLLVEIFARRLAQIDLSLDTSLRNSRVCVIPVVGTEEEALKVAKALNRMYEGDAAVLTTSISWDKSHELFPIKSKDNIISAELADCRQNVMAEFYEYLGIDTIAVDKKERTNLMEMQSNEQRIFINGLRMLEARKKFCDEVKDVFGINMTVKINEEVVRNDASMSENAVNNTANS